MFCGAAASFGAAAGRGPARNQPRGRGRPAAARATAAHAKIRWGGLWRLRPKGGTSPATSALQDLGMGRRRGSRSRLCPRLNP